MAPIISERTRLRRLLPSDLEAMCQMESDADTVRYTPFVFPQTVEQTQRRLNGQIEAQTQLEPFGYWVATLKANNLIVGWFMLREAHFPGPELGFMLRKTAWGKGLATEVAQRLLKYAFLLGRQETFARTNVENVASIKVLEKLGFEYFEQQEEPCAVTDKLLKLNCYMRSGV